MKNLFKNLMLVAVAAMAFTSCSQDVNELNKLEKKTTFEFVASFDGDTRSGFTGSSEDENGKVVYHSEWFGGETVMLVAGDQVKSATVDAEGKFTATFDGEISQIDIYTPMESFYKPYMDYNFYQVNPEVLAEQTPLANSVDPKAHVAKGYVLVDGEGNQIIPVTLAHEVAYGKMTVNTPAEFVIDHVEIALNGVFDGSTRNLSYTINADKVENNVFWFATEPITVSDFTVTAYDAEGKAYTKSVTIPEGRTLAFGYGRVGSFSVSKLEEYTEVVTYDYDYAYISKEWGSTDKLITFTGEGKQNLNVNFAGRSFDGNAIAAGTYYYGDGVYSYGISLGDYDTGSLTAGKIDSVVVSIVDGCYVMEFNGLVGYYGETLAERLTFKGTIDGLGIPDLRARLATPEVTYELNGKTLTVSWNAVEGAVGYYIHDYYNDIDTTTTKKSITVELTEYKWYYIYVSAIAADDDANLRDSDEAEISFELKDPRQILANPTNIAATVDGKYATITWDPVQGADYYYVEYYLDGNQSIEVTDASVTLEIGYSKSVWVYVQSRANDDNPNYRSSTDWNAYVQVNTGKDPNVFADYIYDTLSWNSQYSRFELTGNGNGMTQFYVNSSDSPNNNSIKAGTYTYAGNTVQYPSVGTFSLRYLLGSGAGSSHYVYDASMSVTIENGEYNIIITIIDAGNGNVEGKTFGYKGLPDGFVLPDGSGSEEPENPGDGGEEDDSQYGDGTQGNPYIYTCNVVKSGGYYRLTFTSQAAGAKSLYLESNNDIAGEFKVGAITAANNWYPNACKYANGTITTAWDESTISFTHVGGTIYSFDEIKISTFNGYVYYKCDSVNLY